LNNVKYSDLVGVSYKTAWELQTRLHSCLIDHKMLKRRSPELILEDVHHHLLFCEHNHVFTLGKSGNRDHLLLSDAELIDKSIEFFKINRGGDITYHGPGQITGYPIFDLDYFYTDVHRYVREIEQAVINTLLVFGIIAGRIEGYTGVWILADKHNPINRKICAIGVHLSRWVTMHGFALNVNTDLSYFDLMIPCGIKDEDKTVTSIATELGQSIPIEVIKSVLKDQFANIFGLNFIE
jgi:lipoyl(octanoyl) transferase